MAERFYLGLWLRDHDGSNMLSHFRVLLESFPYSQTHPRLRGVRVYPLSWTEHPVLEEDFAEEGAELEHGLRLASDFLHDDYAYEAEAFWDLWIFQKNGGPGAWKVAPRLVRLLCHGPGFEEGAQNQGDLTVDFGLDTPFRAAEEPSDPRARVVTIDHRDRLKGNIEKLLEFVRVVNERLPVEKKLIWTESGENFAELIQRSFR